MTEPGSRLLQLKILLRDVHPAVWRWIRLADSLSIADLHRVIQLLMGWDDDHLHRFRIHGRDYGIAYIGGPNFGEDAAAVPLSWFGFRPTKAVAEKLKDVLVIRERRWNRRDRNISWFGAAAFAVVLIIGGYTWRGVQDRDATTALRQCYDAVMQDKATGRLFCQLDLIRR